MASIERRETSRGVRYDVRYRDLTGRQREQTFTRKSAAERFKRKVEADKDRGLFVDPKLARKPVTDVAHAWLESNPGKRDGSWQRDEIVIRRHIVPAIGTDAIGGVTPGDVQALVNRWARSLAPRTVRRQYGVVRAIFNYAVNNDMIGRSPCRSINLPEVTPVRVRQVDADDLARLSKAMGGLGKYGPMPYLGTIDGLRWGEVAGLRVGRVDFEACTISVETINVRGRHGRVGEGQPKSAAGRRTLAAPPELMAMLMEHMAKLGLTVADGDALLFTAPNGGQLRYDNWRRRVWYPACVAAKLGEFVKDDETGKVRYEGLDFHDLRRNAGTGLVADGVDPKTAQVVLGHSDVRLTLEIYAQQVDDRKKAAAEAMGARFLGATVWGRRGMESEQPSQADGGPTRKEAPVIRASLTSRGGGI